MSLGVGSSLLVSIVGSSRVLACVADIAVVGSHRWLSGTDLSGSIPTLVGTLSSATVGRSPGNSLTYLRSGEVAVAFVVGESVGIVASLGSLVVNGG